MTEKQILINQIVKIQTMSQDDLNALKDKIAISNISQKARHFVFEAISVRESELRARNDALVEDGELKVGEI